MKKFIIKLLFFLLPLFLLSIPVDFFLSYLLRQSTEAAMGEMQVWNDIYNSKINCEIAIYGSSRAWVHIDPQILNDSLGLTAYNFGLDGHNFWLQYFRHSQFLKYNQKPKQIILSVDIFSLEKRGDLYNYLQFLPYMLWNMDIYHHTKSYQCFSKTDYFIPLIRYAGKVKALFYGLKFLFNGNSKRLRNNGFAAMDKPWNKDLERARLEKGQYEVELNEESIALLTRFVKECKKNNIELILVYTPEYLDGQKFVINREQVFKIFKKIAAEYRLRFYDYSSDKISFNKSFFYNSSHLNKVGSELFTKKFAHDLKLEQKRK